MSKNHKSVENDKPLMKQKT